MSESAYIPAAVLAEIIGERLERAGLNVDELAHRAHLTPRCVQRIVYGETRRCTARHADRITTALDYPEAWHPGGPLAHYPADPPRKEQHA